MTSAIPALVVALGALTADPFEIEVRPVVAVEGGPVVLDLTLNYRGHIPLRLGNYAFRNPIDLTLPAAWQPMLRPRLMSFISVGLSTGTLFPGNRIGHRVSIHRKYHCLIKPGRSVVQVSTCLGPRESQQQVVLNVEPWNPQTAARLKRQIVEAVRDIESRRLPSWEYQTAVDQVCDLVLDSTHPELASDAVHLLRLDMSPRTTRELCRFVLRAQSTAKNLNRALVEHVLSDRSLHVPEVFAGWSDAERTWSRLLGELLNAVVGPPLFMDDIGEVRCKTPLDRLAAVWTILADRQHRLSDADLKRLAETDNVAVKTFTYLTFRHRLGPEWVRRYEAELLAHVNGPTEERLQQLVRQLDADAFKVRAAATAEFLRLIDLGQTRQYLAKAASETTSAEVRNRIRQILSSPRPSRASALERELVAELSSRTAAHRRVRELIASGDPNSSLVKQVRAIHAARR